MATTTKNKSATRKTTAPKAPAAKPEEIEKSLPVEEEDVFDPDPSEYVIVRSGFHGILVYISRKTGEEYVWDNFGDEQEMELRELRNAKTSQKDFFINNWFTFDDPRIIEWLGVEQYYKHMLDSANFDDIFTKSPARIKEIIADLSVGQRESVEFRAKELFKKGELDSLKVITALEEALGVEIMAK